MNYYKDSDGGVFYYDDQQLAVVDLINTSNDQAIISKIPAVFFEINDAIKNMVEMTPEEIDHHINPPVVVIVTPEQQEE